MVLYWCYLAQSNRIITLFSFSDGNLATKQVVFLQRPVRNQASGQSRNQVSTGDELVTDSSDVG